LKIPDVIDVHLVDSSLFGTLSAAWLLVIICDIIIIFKVLKLLPEAAERYVILAVLSITAPLAFSMGGILACTVFRSAASNVVKATERLRRAAVLWLPELRPEPPKPWPELREPPEPLELPGPLERQTLRARPERHSSRQTAGCSTGRPARRRNRVPPHKAGLRAWIPPVRLFKEAERPERCLYPTMDALDRRLAELEKLAVAAYEDKVKSAIPKAVCIQLMKRYEDERTDELKQGPKLTAQLEACQEDEKAPDDWRALFRDYSRLEGFERPALD